MLWVIMISPLIVYPADDICMHDSFPYVDISKLNSPMVGSQIHIMATTINTLCMHLDNMEIDFSILHTFLVDISCTGSNKTRNID